MEYSLFEEASRDHEAEARDQRMAFVRMAMSEEIFPFLALAQSEQEYEHRKALAADSLSSIAARYDASPAETEGVADRMYRLMVEAKQQGDGLQYTANAVKCGNCEHSSVDHTEGLRCQCGCTDFTPETSKEARRVTAEEGDGPFS